MSFREFKKLDIEKYLKLYKNIPLKQFVKIIDCEKKIKVVN